MNNVQVGALLLLSLVIVADAQTKTFANKELTVAAFQGAYGVITGTRSPRSS